MSKPDDTDLVTRTLEGDRRAFEALIDRYERPVYNAAFRMLNDSDDARDVAQTVFLKAYEKLGDFNPEFRFFSWIYRIALNESVNHLNRRSRTEELAEEPAAGQAGPDDEMDREMQSRRLQVALMRIKPDYRAVIVLKHFLDDIPEGKVKSRLYSGRQLLKDALASGPDS